MEEELKCPVCKQLYNNPVLLPCFHSLCLNCAVRIQVPALQQNGVGSNGCKDPGSEREESSATSATGSEPSSTDYQEADKLSVLSETDSGVVCISRPNSYVGTPNMNGSLFPPVGSNALSLSCPSCKKLVYFDENGSYNLPKYRAMQAIVDKFTEQKSVVLKCQLCEGDPAQDASVMCDQCEVLYCDTCRENCHPSRGPLAKHTLLEPYQGRALLRTKAKSKDVQCSDHDDEILSMYCLVCKIPACPLCLDSKHTSHDVVAINSICKSQKTEMSQHLQQLSEKAKAATEFIQRLKGLADQVHENCFNFEESISLQCDLLVQAIRNRKDQLLEFIRQDKEKKLRALKDQVSTCTYNLQHTTGLLQFCIEVLKETDSAAFLQVESSLISRVADMDLAWDRDLITSPRASPSFDLTLDDSPVLRAIQQFNFIQMKPAKDGEERVPEVPGPPSIIAEECSAENNSVTIAWQQPPTSYVEGYVLELDDGTGGEFREVYCGKETICTVDGLHFCSMYNARVKAFNGTGEGDYSELIGLQTAEVAWFTFDPCIGPAELIYSEDNCSVTCEGYEHRVALGSVGFSRGVHYWEFLINKYDSDTDPSFGVARLDVVKDEMLGKDEKGWSMYIDKQRSWFMHDGVHVKRCEGGMQPGSTIGVLLDLERHQLSFYVNEEPQGPIAFYELYGVFYPAVSLNRGVSVTLHTALDPPLETDGS